MLRTGVRAAEDLDFSNTFKISSDSEDSDAFISLRAPAYDPATLNEASDVLDGDGNFTFDVNFCVDMESAARANIRKVEPNRKSECFSSGNPECTMPTL